MRALDSQSEEALTHDVRDEFVQKRSGQAELLGDGQAGRTVRCESVLQVHVDPKGQ